MIIQYNQGRRHGFRPGWANILRENLARIFFSLPTLVFSLPTLDLIIWVGKDPPAITQIKAN